MNYVMARNSIKFLQLDGVSKAANCSTDYMVGIPIFPSLPQRVDNDSTVTPNDIGRTSAIFSRPVSIRSAMS